jgi:hypothetical protein
MFLAREFSVVREENKMITESAVEIPLVKDHPNGIELMMRNER